MLILRLAWRSIWRYRRRTLITVLSIGLGLTFAIFFLTLADGIYSQIIDDGVRMQAGHITLENPGYREAPSVDLWIGGLDETRAWLEGMSAVSGTKLLVLGQGVARSGAGAVGVSVMGVEPDVERRTSPIARDVVEGRYLDKGDGAYAVIGSGLARRLNLKEGKKIVLSTNNVDGTLVEELCRVRGIFETGSDEIDGYLLQVPISFARRLFGLPAGSTTQLGVILGVPEEQGRVLRDIRDRLDGRKVAVYPWQEIIPELASYIRLDRGSNVFFQALLMFLILFTIFNTILMSVVERQREFAVLLALGTPESQLKRQVLVESAFIGAIGCVLGLLLGGLASYAVQVWGLDITSLYREGITISGLAVSTDIHARVTGATLLWTGGLVFAATLLISLFPMRRAVRVPIVETLR